MKREEKKKEGAMLEEVSQRSMVPIEEKGRKEEEEGGEKDRESLKEEGKAMGKEGGIAGDGEKAKKAEEAYEEGRKESEAKGLEGFVGGFGGKKIQVKTGTKRCIAEEKEVKEKVKKELERILEERGVDKLNWVCFPGGTLVQTETGLRRIEEIKEGEKVYAGEKETGEVGLKRVRKVYKRTVHKLIVFKIKGKELKTTAEHPIWIEGRGYVKAEEIEEGEKVRCYEEGSCKEERIEKKEIVLSEERIVVYNLEVEEWNSYLVGEEGIWVHNAKKVLYQDKGVLVTYRHPATGKDTVREIGEEEQENLRKLENSVKEVLGIPTVCYRGIDYKIAQILNMKLRFLFDQFPEVKEKVKYVGSWQGHAEIMTEDKEVVETIKRVIGEKFPNYTEKEIEEEYAKHIEKGKGVYDELLPAEEKIGAYYHVQLFPKYQGLLFNDDKVIDKKSLEEGLKKQVEEKQHVKGGEQARSIIDHEIGHLLDDTYGISESEEMRNFLDNYTKKQIKEELSEYAAASKKELLAEAWRKRVNNKEKELGEMTKKIVDLMLEIIKKKQGKK